jgi:hypothetical protein
VYVLDNGSSIFKAASVEIEWVSDATSTPFNSSYREFKDTRVVFNTISTTRAIVGHFIYSFKATEHLKRIHELKISL